MTCFEFTVIYYIILYYILLYIHILGQVRESADHDLAVGNRMMQWYNIVASFHSGTLLCCGMVYGAIFGRMISLP